MRSSILALVLGSVGAGLGAVASWGAGVISLQPIWALSGGASFAILGAVLGGCRDIVRAIEQTRDRQS
jgi:hypothetical protein